MQVAVYRNMVVALFESLFHSKGTVPFENRLVQKTIPQWARKQEGAGRSQVHLSEVENQQQEQQELHP